VRERLGFGGFNVWLRCETLSGPLLNPSPLFPGAGACALGICFVSSGQLWRVMNGVNLPSLLHL